VRPAALPFTGDETAALTLLGSLLVAAGGAVTVAAGRRATA
jgi:LPXTG-motif cell wall-anchored protein